MPFKNYREESRNTQWGSYQDANLSIEQINCGSMLRIADATEKMSQNYTEIMNDRDWWRNQSKYKDEEIICLNNRIKALKGVITKLKNKSK